MRRPENDRCALTQLGSCPPSCNVLSVAIRMIRWRGMTPEDAAKQTGKDLCPSGCKPQIEKGRNKQASWGFGQRREENWDDLQDLK